MLVSAWQQARDGCLVNVLALRVLSCELYAAEQSCCFCAQSEGEPYEASGLAWLGSAAGITLEFRPATFARPGESLLELSAFRRSAETPRAGETKRHTDVTSSPS